MKLFIISALIISTICFTAGCTVVNDRYYPSYTPYNVSPEYPSYYWRTSYYPGYQHLPQFGTRYYGRRIYYGYDTQIYPRGI